MRKGNFIRAVRAASLALCLMLSMIAVFAEGELTARIPVTVSGADCTVGLFDANGKRVDVLSLAKDETKSFEVTQAGVYTVRVLDQNTDAVKYDRTVYTVRVVENDENKDELAVIVDSPEGASDPQKKLDGVSFENDPETPDTPHTPDTEETEPKPEPPESKPGTEPKPETKPGTPNPPETKPGTSNPPETKPGTPNPPETRPGTPEPPETRPGTPEPPETNPPKPQEPPETQPTDRGVTEPEPTEPGPPETWPTPTDGPETLPQTGTLRWLVPYVAAASGLLVTAGAVLVIKAGRHGREE